MHSAQGSDRPEFIEPLNFSDHRGTIRKFVDISKSKFFPNGFMDEYLATSHKNVFRGFHRQVGAFATTKLFFVAQGEIDLYVLDPEMEMFTHESLSKYRLSPETGALIVPQRFFTGYLAVSECAVVLAKGSAIYASSAEDTLPPAKVFTAQEMKDWILSTKDSI